MVTTTEAAILVEIGEPLQVIELELPELAAGQVLVALECSGVCHSQLNEIRGLRGPDRFLPHCLGHEAVGTVRTVGGDVTKVEPGQRVVLTWLKGEGSDVPGTTYRSSIGTVNAGAVTTFMRDAVVSENRLVPITGELDGPIAALLGCAVPTGAGAVRHSLGLEAGEHLAVIGCGGIGLMAVMTAAATGAAVVVAVDVNPDRLEVARAVGATHTVDATTTDTVAAVVEATAGGADAVLEAAGTTATMEQAVRCARERGGRIVLAGNPPAGQTLAVDPFDLIRGRHLTGSWGGDGDVDRDIPLYATMAADGTLPLHRIVGAAFALAQVNDAVEALASGATTRPMIVFD